MPQLFGKEKRRKADRHIPAPPVGEEAGVNNLPVQVALTVPSTEGADRIDKDEFEARIVATRKWFDDRFGGDTTIRGSGGFVTEANELIEEPVAIVESSMSIDSYHEHYREFGQFVKDMREKWQQDAITYRIEQRVFIYPSKDYIDNDETVPSGIVQVT